MANDVVTARVALTQGVAGDAIAGDADRIGWRIQNEGPGDCRISPNATPTALLGHLLKEGKTYEVLGSQGANMVTGDWDNKQTIECFPLGNHSGAGGQDPTAKLVLQTEHWIKA